MATIETTMTIHDRVSRNLDKMTTANEKLVKSLRVTDQVTEQARPAKAYEEASVAARRAGQEVDAFNQKQQQAERGAKSVGSAWSAVGGFVKAAMAAFSVNKIIDTADALTLNTARLDMMNDGLQTTEELYGKIAASANRARAKVRPTVEMIAALGAQAGDAFTSNDELIAFTEQLNKTFVVAGTSAMGIESTMYNLTQALASGVLRGQDLNSVMSNAMPIVQNIADYMGMTVGEIRQAAAEGKITARVVKNAMLAAAEETNAAFEKMPMTFGQLASLAANAIEKALEPVIQWLGEAAQWIYDNWENIAPVFYGVATAIGVLVAAYAIWEIAQWALNAAMWANPIFALIGAIGLLAGAIAYLINKVGGLEIAWLILTHSYQTAMDQHQTVTSTIWNWILDQWNTGQMTIKTITNMVVNHVNDMAARSLMLLQNMVNGAINIINGFIDLLNNIPGVSIEAVGQVTFGTSAQMQNEANKQARNDELAEYRENKQNEMANRWKELENFKATSEAEAKQREAEIIAKRRAQLEGEKEVAKGGGRGGGVEPYEDAGGLGGGGVPNIGKVGEVGRIRDEVDISKENLELLRDVAEARFVQNFVKLTPSVSLRVDNLNNADPDELIAKMEQTLEEEFAATAEGVYM